jgi:hypothetical protein
MKMHSKGNVFAVRFVLAHGKGNGQANGGNVPIVR